MSSHPPPPTSSSALHSMQRNSPILPIFSRAYQLPFSACATLARGVQYLDRVQHNAHFLYPYLCLKEICNDNPVDQRLGRNRRP